jgi:hypothetical protein
MHVNSTQVTSVVQAVFLRNRHNLHLSQNYPRPTARHTHRHKISRSKGLHEVIPGLIVRNGVSSLSFSYHNHYNNGY